MADALDVAGQVQEHLDRWNAPTEDHTLASLVGKPAPEGDTRVSANRGTDATGNPYADDGDLPEVPLDEDGEPLYAEMKNADLEAHLKARGLSTAGNKDEMVERLEEDDTESE
jgi:hypothetical protein